MAQSRSTPSMPYAELQKHRAKVRARSFPALNEQERLDNRRAQILLNRPKGKAKD